MDVQAVYELLEKDLSDVKNVVHDKLNETKTDESAPVIEYLLSTQGKLIRPILVFLSAYAIDDNLAKEKRDKLVLVAAAIEIIHMASLVHDDVIDDADSRRNKQSIKAKFGNVTAVTMGVYLYSVSLQLIAQAGSIAILDELSLTVKKMCEGELKQLDFVKNSSTHIDTYFDIIYSKTAVLFKSASLVGCLLFNKNSNLAENLKVYSTSLGYVFQLTDDYLDIMATQDDLKKSIGQDFLKGQLTLPMIYALDIMNDTEKANVFECIKNKDLKGLDIIKTTITDKKIDLKLNSLIEKYLSEATDAVNKLPQNQFNQALQFFVDYFRARLNPN